MIRKVEFFLENHIEGFFNKKFSSDLTVAELEKRLEKEMTLKKKKRRSKWYAPNYYAFYLAESDYCRMCSKELHDRLYVHLIRAAILHKFLIEGKVSVHILKDATLKKGCFRAVAESRVQDAADESEEQADAAECNSTIVFQKPDAPRVAAAHKISAVSVVEGEDEGARLDIGEKRVHIGRRVCNEFYLSDRSASRLHAYIAFERCRHVLYDADSLNGTYVNGNRIDSQILDDGDRIKIGKSVLLYEVSQVAG